MLILARAALVIIYAVIFGSAWVHTQPSARLAPDLVVLNVTVTDPAGRLVSDLSAADFQILEDGQPQEAILFLPGSAPLSWSLLVDSSTSMDEEMSDVQETLEELVQQLRPQDSGELIEFDARPKVLQPPTHDPNVLAAAVKRLRAGGATSLNNALYVTLRQLSGVTLKIPRDRRRRAVVVLSDGQDTSSLVTRDVLLDVVRRSHAVIYAIGLHTSESGEAGLRELTSETGGQFVIARRAADLRRAFAQIARELASQYALGYVSSNRSSGDEWREIVVEVRRPDVKVRTRPGYLR